jgi:cardiolipin synthase
MTRRDIPNALCVLRIALVLPLLWAIMTRQFVLATLLFGFAGFTDALDGFLARRYEWHSSLGALLDPIADKVLTIGVFVTLMLVGLVPRWLALLVIGRDVILLSGGVAFRVLVGPFEGRASGIGKFNTATMLLFVLLLLCRAAFGWPADIVLVTLGAVLIVAVVASCFDYGRQWITLARAARRVSSA